MNWRPVSHPKLSSAVVESTNLLLSRKLPIQVRSASETYSIRTYPAKSDYNACLVLDFDVGGAAVLAYFNSGLLNATLVDLMPTEQFETLDDDLKLAVLEVALDKPLASLKEVLHTPVTLQKVVAGDDCSHRDGPSNSSIDQSPVATFNSTPWVANALQFEIGRQSESDYFTVQIEILSALPEPICNRLIESCATRRRNLGHLPIPVTFELGAVALSTGELGSLEAGDILLFDESYIALGKVRVNIARHRFLLADVDDQSLTVQGSQRPDSSHA